MTNLVVQKIKSREFVLFNLGILFILFFCLNSFFLVSAGELKVTLEHPFLIDGKWISASQLKVGDVLQTVDGKNVTIKSIKSVSEENNFSVYNLEAGEYHNFVVCGEENCSRDSLGVVVHNSNAKFSIRKYFNPYTDFGDGVQIEHIRTNVKGIHVTSDFGNNPRAGIKTIFKYVKEHPDYKFILHTPNPTLVEHFEGLENFFKKNGFVIEKSIYSPYTSERIAYYTKSLFNARYHAGKSWFQLTLKPNMAEFIPGSRMFRGILVNPSTLNFAMLGGSIAVSSLVYGVGSIIQDSLAIQGEVRSVESLFAEVNGCAKLLKDNSLNLYINIPNSLLKYDCPIMNTSQIFTACSNLLSFSELSDYSIISNPIDADFFLNEYFENSLLDKYGLVGKKINYPACIYVLKRPS